MREFCKGYRGLDVLLVSHADHPDDLFGRIALDADKIGPEFGQDVDQVGQGGAGEFRYFRLNQVAGLRQMYGSQYEDLGSLSRGDRCLERGAQ